MIISEMTITKTRNIITTAKMLKNAGSKISANSLVDASIVCVKTQKDLPPGGHLLLSQFLFQYQ